MLSNSFACSLHQCHQFNAHSYLPSLFLLTPRFSSPCSPFLTPLVLSPLSSSIPSLLTLFNSTSPLLSHPRGHIIPIIHPHSPLSFMPNAMPFPAVPHAVPAPISVSPSLQALFFPCLFFLPALFPAPFYLPVLPLCLPLLLLPSACSSSSFPLLPSSPLTLIPPSSSLLFLSTAFPLSRSSSPLPRPSSPRRLSRLPPSDLPRLSSLLPPCSSSLSEVPLRPLLPSSTLTVLTPLLSLIISSSCSLSISSPLLPHFFLPSSASFTIFSSSFRWLPFSPSLSLRTPPLPSFTSPPCSTLPSSPSASHLLFLSLCPPLFGLAPRAAPSSPPPPLPSLPAVTRAAIA
ncbi:unnamed protein product [Closterium sp. Naga37s-1]|nr:unnamed protein product [Closterium sp. Naga37s-1]